MTQMILNIENPDIIPSLRKVLGQIKGVRRFGRQQGGSS